MLIALGTITVFILASIFSRKSIKEESSFIVIPVALTAVAFFAFLAQDYEIAEAQPFKITEETYPLEAFDNGKYLNVEYNSDGTSHLYTKFNGELFDARYYRIKHTSGESYVVKKHKTAKKDSIWLRHELDKTTYVFYIHKDDKENK